MSRLNSYCFFNKPECDYISKWLIQIWNYLYTHTVDENIEHLGHIIEGDKSADIEMDAATCYVINVCIYIITLYKLGASNERAIYHIKTSVEQIGDLIARIEIYGFQRIEYNER